MRSPLTYLLTLKALLLLCPVLKSQSDTTAFGADKLFRPAIYMNTGVISYFGDVGRLDGLSRSPSLNFGTTLGLVSPLTDEISIKAFALFGSITEEERIPNGNANFRTPIRMGGISLAYNFAHFLPEDRWIEPYVGVGISTFEFNSKADLTDANGNPYHYWSDGTIRSLPESSPNKNNAVFLERDFTYESDLRETNEASLPYNLRGFSIPLSAGANIRINDFFTLNMGADFHVSFTDNLDNISDGGNDHFLFSSIGLMYNLHHRKKSPTEKQGTHEFDNLDFEDEDGDGIADILDQCPFTGKDVVTDEFGCPLDSDGDGVADHVDLDPYTERGVPVTADGQPLTDEAIETMFLAYKDSVGNLNYLKSRTETADYEGDFVRMGDRSKGFRILILDTDDLDANKISKLLSVPDVKGSFGEDGATEYFVGDFQSLDEAVEIASRLENMNYHTKLVYNKFGEFTTVYQSEVNLVKNSLEAIPTDFDQVIFRVQIGAYRYQLSKNVFKDVDDLLVIRGTDGLVRYVSGSFNNIKEAAEHKIDLLLMGFEGAFVTAYRGGKRISLKEAGARVKGKENLKQVNKEGGINSERVNYSILLGTFKGRIPAEALGKFIELNGVRPMRGKQGTTKYIFGEFASKEEAKKELNSLKSEGFEEATLIGIFNGNLISSEEADRLKKE